MPSFEVLAWDSAFFGIKIGRIVLESATPEELGKAVREARRDGIECLYWQVNCADRVSPRAAELCGFRLVDIRVTLEQPLQEQASSLAETLHPAAQRVRPFIPGDLPAILALARNSHRDSRFFYDGHFRESQCETLYEEWLRKSCEGGAQFVLIAEDSGRAAGYCACSLSDDGAGNIGLIAVDPRCHRSGLGTALVQSALRCFSAAGMRVATVVTQGRNLASQRLYQRCGFVTRSMQLSYHWWAAGEPKEF